MQTFDFMVEAKIIATEENLFTIKANTYEEARAIMNKVFGRIVENGFVEGECDEIENTQFVNSNVVLESVQTQAPTPGHPTLFLYSVTDDKYISDNKI